MLLPLLLLLSANCLLQTGADDAEPDSASSFAWDSDNADLAEICKNVTLKCDDTEYLDNCPSYCVSDLCPTGEGQNKGCAQPDPCPRPACKCRFGYKRAHNWTCIPTRSCPPFTCDRPNEEYNPCPPLCPTDSCSQATPTGKCPFPGRIGIVLPCEPACRCKKGYWRNYKGVCVPYNQCPNIQHPKCGANEVVDNCPASCESDYCSSYNKRVTCTKPKVCPPPACKCKTGYRRARNHTCIPERECRKDNCSGPNEYYVNCTSLGCDNVCKTLHEQNQYNCPIRFIRCTDMCFCKEGHARNEKGICIPIDKCPQRQQNTNNGQCILPNEEYTDCKKECPSDKCISIVSRCIPSETCSPGCVCKSGYLRKDDGLPCMPLSQCPELANSPDYNNQTNCNS